MPPAREVAMMPMASDEEETSAMAASEETRPCAFKRSRRNADSSTTGKATPMGAQFSAVATESAPNPTWERPSPIME